MIHIKFHIKKFKIINFLFSYTTLTVTFSLCLESVIEDIKLIMLPGLHLTKLSLVYKPYLM